jgi:phosphatidylserine decarboxylase
MIHSMMNSIRQSLVPIHREGYPFIAICAGVALLLFLLRAPLAWPVVVLALWVTYFFRDPARVVPVREGLVLSGADGTVSSVAEAVPPAELGLGEAPRPRVSVFMNVFNCHVNRTPVNGRIDTVSYRPGAFFNAELDKASEHNERKCFRIVNDAGVAIGMVQIAGLVARRIVSFAEEGDEVVAGDRIGLIRFGSRVDIYLPPGTVPLVGAGQTAVAGETVIADLAPESGSAAERSWRVI